MTVSLILLFAVISTIVLIYTEAVIVYLNMVSSALPMSPCKQCTDSFAERADAFMVIIKHTKGNKCKSTQAI